MMCVNFLRLFYADRTEMFPSRSLFWLSWLTSGADQTATAILTIKCNDPSEYSGTLYNKRTPGNQLRFQMKTHSSIKLK